MINEQIEKELVEHLKRFTDEFKKVAEGVLGDAYCGILPYVLDDTVLNSKAQAEDMVRDIIAGNFDWDGDYIVISAREFSPRIRISFNAIMYDSMRDALIERMPKCPKDAKIAALEDALKRAYKGGY